ncbi:MAG: thioredoxin domain-containing protein [Patescibacteria group bacterium]
MITEPQLPVSMERVVYRTPPKVAFTTGILAGITLMSLVGFGMMYSIARTNDGTTKKTANTNTAGTVAGTNVNAANTNAAAVPTKVDIALRADDHVRGDSTAAVTLVAYSDFQCPYCSAVNPTIEKVLADYPGQVRLVFRHFPLSFHENAQKAAEASECASVQGKFWEMHDKMFANQSKLTIADLKGYAKELGLNATKFNSCLDDGTYASKVQTDETQGGQYGVNGTPATFVNGTLISGAVPYAQFKAAVDSALAAAQ